MVCGRSARGLGQFRTVPLAGRADWMAPVVWKMYGMTTCVLVVHESENDDNMAASCYHAIVSLVICE